MAPAILLAVFVVTDRLLFRISTLPAAGYAEGVIVLEVVTRLLTWSVPNLIALLMVAALALVLLRTRSLGASWTEFDGGPKLRVFIGLIVVLLAWVFVTYEYNFYFGQRHGLDRLLLILLTLLAIWRPFFVLPFVFVLLPVIQQFNHPIGGFSGAQALLPVRILILFVCTFVLALLTKRSWTPAFVLLTCCMVASSYWSPGLGKLELGWLPRDQIHFLLPSTYANGWLGFLDSEAISTLTRSLSVLNWPMKSVTVIAEIGALVCLWNTSTMRFFLVVWIILHVGIFLMSGICFWMWMILNCALLILFFGRAARSVTTFTRAQFLLSVFVIAGGGLLFRPAKLAWLDARATYTYRFEGTGEDGSRYTLPPAYFAPFEYQFTLGNFHYLQEDPHLPIVWGATGDRVVADALTSLTDADELLELEAAHGRVSFNPRRAAVFDEFVERFVGNRNTHGVQVSWWRLLPAIPELWTFPLSPRGVPAQITGVTVHQVLSLYDGSQYREIRQRPVRFIKIAETAGRQVAK